MTEPRIQYAKTSDGVSIAFYTLGKGEPLVSIPGIPFSHLQMEWKIPDVRRWYDRLAERGTLVRYDGRGNGLSERDVTDYSLDAQVRDLEAIVDHLAIDRFSLLGGLFAGLVAVTYAARHPERVSHLILWCPFARGSSYLDASPVQMLTALSDKDWSVYTETVAHARVGWSSGELAHQVATFFQESITPDALQSTYESIREMDVTDLLPQVVAPALVLHRRQVPVPDMTDVRVVASGIPSARLVVLEGESPYYMVGDIESVAAAIDEFLSEGEVAAPKTGLPEGMAVILFADIADSTALTERMGDAAFRDKARELDASLRAIIRECSGTPVEGKVLGDGVLAVFTSARQAIECALRCNGAGETVGLQLHLGIHAGDVIREGNNVYGGAVNIAARIAGASAPGEVLVSDTVRGLARTSAGVTFDDRGEHELKGVADPQRLFAVREGGA
jgi:class 3 adenylate cyclase